MNGIRNFWHRSPKVVKIPLMIILGLTAAVLFGFIFGFVVKFLWNWLMPELFNLREITYWQAVGLVILSRLVFGSFGGSHGRGRQSYHNNKKHHQWQCTDEKEDIKDEIRHWKYYDEWWQFEGKQAFDNYVEKRNEEKESKDDSEQNPKV